MPEHIAIISIIVSFFTGGAAGSIITLTVTGRRDRASRKRSFIAFMRSWRTEVDLFHPSTVLGQNPVITRFRDNLPRFMAEVDLARGAFDNCAKFNFLTKYLAGLSDADLHKKTPREVVLDAIDEVIRYAA